METITLEDARRVTASYATPAWSRRTTLGIELLTELPSKLHQYVQGSKGGRLRLRWFPSSLRCR
jgi:hypothetical protein